MNLVASLVTKNELKRYLQLNIEHLLEFVDRIAVLDDNSDDGTYEWLLRQPKVAVLTNGGPGFYADESKVRNNLLAWTLAQDPTYILSVDADEFVEDGPALRAACEKGHDVYALEMQEVWRADVEKLEIRVDGQWANRQCPLLWKAPPALDKNLWRIPPRRLACGREPLAVRRASATPTFQAILHFGWTRPSERQARFDRYAKHDKGRYHKNSHLQSILWPDEKVLVADRSWPQGLSALRESMTYL